MDQNVKNLGKQIRIWRKSDRITQQELAAKSGVPLTAIRRCEQKGQIPMERYVKLITTLGGSLQPQRSQSGRNPIPFSKAVRQALIQIGVKPIQTDWKTLQKQKEAQRRKDWSRIQRGLATPEEIQQLNSVVPLGAGKEIRIVDWGKSLS